MRADMTIRGYLFDLSWLMAHRHMPASPTPACPGAERASWATRRGVNGWLRIVPH